MPQVRGKVNGLSAMIDNALSGLEAPAILDNTESRMAGLITCNLVII